MECKHARKDDGATSAVSCSRWEQAPALEAARWPLAATAHGHAGPLGRLVASAALFSLPLVHVAHLVHQVSMQLRCVGVGVTSVRVWE